MPSSSVSSAKRVSAVEQQQAGRETELFSLYEDELGGVRPDRLYGVRPRDRDRRTVKLLCRYSCAAHGG